MLKLNSMMLLALSAVSLTGMGNAADMKDMKGMDMSGMQVKTAKVESAEGLGVIKAMNKTAGTVTIDHQPIKAFSWPAMIMPFKVADPKLLDTVVVGNKVRFTLQGKDMMKSTVTALSVAR